MIGQTFSRYRILKVLGSDETGIVYKAEDESVSHIVALKLLPREVTRDQMERFRGEELSAYVFNHSNIRSIYDIGEEGGQVS